MPPVMENVKTASHVDARLGRRHQNDMTAPWNRVYFSCPVKATGTGLASRFTRRSKKPPTVGSGFFS